MGVTVTLVIMMVPYDADHDQATNGFGSKILKVFKLSGYLQ